VREKKEPFLFNIIFVFFFNRYVRKREEEILFNIILFYFFVFFFDNHVREKKEPFLFNIIHFFLFVFFFNHYVRKREVDISFNIILFDFLFNNQVTKNLLHVKKSGVEIFFLNFILFFLTMGSNQDGAPLEPSSRLSPSSTSVYEEPGLPFSTSAKSSSSSSPAG